MKNKLADVLLGGLGGAIVATLIAIIMNQYFAGVEREARTNAKEDILAAKQEVINGIREARNAERKHILDAIAQSERARVYAETARQQSTEFLRTLSDQETRANAYLEEQQRRIKKLASDQEQRINALAERTVQGLTGKKGISPSSVAAILRDQVIDQIGHPIPQGIVSSFASAKCPEGWEPYNEAMGRVIVGSGKTEGVSLKQLFETGGEEHHTLTVQEMPSHRHQLPTFTGQPGTQEVGSGHFGLDWIPEEWSKETGQGKPHNNMQPYIALLYCRKT